MAVLFIILGFIALVIGGEFLVRSSIAISFRLNISKMVIGLTVVSFATSLPELLVSLQAALDGFSDISVGNVVGSNIANLGLVLGITAMIMPIKVDRDFFKLNWPVMILLSFGEGIAFFASLIIYLFVLLRRARKKDEVVVEEVDEKLQKTSTFKIILWLIIGGAGLYFGSEWLVDGAVDIAQNLGVSERVISVTMIAFGTSVPELAASLIAALKKEEALSIGNLIGSNIFNIGSVLGLTAIIQPITGISQTILSNDIFWMLSFALILFPLVILPKRHKIGRYKGALLFIGYAVFVGMTYIQG